MQDMTATKFMDSTRKTWTSLQGNISSLIYKLSFTRLYGYEDILLSVFIDICNNGDLRKLIKRGKASIEALADQWEQILADNDKAKGSLKVDGYFQLMKTYGELVAKYLIIKTHVTILTISVNKDSITYLKSQGYHVDTKSNATYYESLYGKRGLIKRVNNIVQKVRLKHNELKNLQIEEEQKNKGVKKTSFHEVMANINYAWPNRLPNDVTLAEYNECIKILKKHEASRDKGRS